jgi:hypothetical protein
MVAKAKDALLLIAVIYLGPSDLGYKCVDETRHRDDIHNGQRNSLLLCSLTEGTRYPPKDYRVDRVYAWRIMLAYDVSKLDFWA